jgi:hypothetical protein
MEQSACWEDSSHSASQEIPYPLQHQKVHYHIHKNQLLDRVLNQMNPAHILTPHFFKINFNIVLPFMHRCS